MRFPLSQSTGKRCFTCMRVSSGLPGKMLVLFQATVFKDGKPLPGTLAVSLEPVGTECGKGQDSTVGFEREEPAVEMERILLEKD